MVSRLLRIPRAVETPLVMLAAIILGLAFPGSTAQAQAPCGGEGQRPCTIFERVPSCNSGMKEDFGQGKCVKMATPCGAAGQRPCLIVERVLSCDPGSYEDLGQNLCVKKTPCGAAGGRPCRIEERIPSCDKGLVEDFGKGMCVVLGDFLRDGFGKCVHVPGMSDANGVQLRTWDCGVNLAHLTWEKVPLILGSDTPEEAPIQPFWLKNRLTGKCAAVHAGQKDDGALVIQWDCGSGKHFQWGWLPSGQIIHRESQKCLHSESGGHNVPLTIVECARIEVPKGKQWTYTPLPKGLKIVPSLTDENMPGTLKNGLGSCLQVPDESADGAQLTTWDCNPDLTQILWRREKGPFTDWAYFYLANRLTGKCAAVQAGQKHDGAAVVQWQCGGIQPGENFYWQVVRGGQLVHKESGKCLEVVSRDRNAKAALGTCVEIAVPENNKWVLVKPGGEEYR